ncbi:hypothetical protein [Streptomyces qinzhouensis]|uniref:Uncharacterized protein n=1 Tax=Streptomyces qinzhouensis TaxID=2599401 RepID=A0A5B8JHT3_9ACTN|nr:hypothetical protein [Streptomyces qinzhouensis]QDY77360.1 hypothetical protein FQU76_13440 [Streptomyces qinzhouensis]
MQPSRPAPPGFAALAAAFPSHLAESVARVHALMPEASGPPSESFSVVVRGETLAIPYRIYHPEPDPAAERALPRTERTVLDCLYSRHHNGRVRERRISGVLTADEPWAVPFVVRLLGEYVVEIVAAIRRELPGPTASQAARRALYGEFIAANPDFRARTEQQMVSYWACYYRHEYPAFADYPGAAPAALLRDAAAEWKGRT